MTAKFELGQVVATPGALETALRSGVQVEDLVDRHESGDWGDVPEYDRQLNELGVTTRDRILSSYGEGDARLWVITDSGHQVTTVLRPDEY